MTASAEVMAMAQEITASPLANGGSRLNARSLDLPAGRYVVSVLESDVSVAGRRTLPAVVSYNAGSEVNTNTFLNRGSRPAHVGEALEVEHHGGSLGIHFATGVSEVDGSARFRVERIGPVAGSPAATFTASQLATAFHDWSVSRGAGCAVVLSGQRYALCRGPGDAAIALPFDDHGLMLHGDASFVVRPEVQRVLDDLLRRGEYDRAFGESTRPRYLLHRFAETLVPV